MYPFYIPQKTLKDGTIVPKKKASRFFSNSSYKGNLSSQADDTMLILTSCIVEKNGHYDDRCRLCQLILQFIFYSLDLQYVFVMAPIPFCLPTRIFYARKCREYFNRTNAQEKTYCLNKYINFIINHINVIYYKKLYRKKSSRLKPGEVTRFSKSNGINRLS